MSPSSLRRAFLFTVLFSPALCAQAQFALRPVDETLVEPLELPTVSLSSIGESQTSASGPRLPTIAPIVPVKLPVTPSEDKSAPHLNLTPAVPVSGLTLPLPVVPPSLPVPSQTTPRVPVTPATPTTPSTPTLPGLPVTPVQPSVPGQLTLPAQPTTPAKVSPVTPASPTPTLSQPGQVAPGSPALPTETSAPASPAVSSPTTAPKPGALPLVAVRGLWVDGFGVGLKTRVQAKQTVDDAVKLGVNTLFVQAIRRGDCLCMKSGLPLATDSDLEKNYDPLAVVTKLAHEKGLRVIAWASVTGIINTASPSKDPKHVMWAHGAKSRDSWLARRADGSWQVGSDGWLDAGIPAAADYAAQGVINLVKNYDVDGVQLDRIRYPDGGNWGYDPKTIARFNAEMGTHGRPAATDPLWQQWKRDQVTALVRRIALEVKSVRPAAWMSAATITYGTPPQVSGPGGFRKSQPYNDVLQDWVTWIYDGLIDLNVPMNYKRDGVGQQSAWFNGWNAYAGSVRTRADGQVAPLAIGTALYLNTPQVTASQAQRSIQAGLGWVGYSYRAPTLASYASRESLVQGLENLRQALTAPGAALAAPQAWKDTPPTSHGLIGRVTGVVWPGHRTVEAWQGGRLVATSLTDGNGYYGFLTLPAGQTEVRVSGQRWTDSVPGNRVVQFPDLLLRDSVQPVKTSQKTLPLSPAAGAAPAKAKPQSAGSGTGTGLGVSPNAAPTR